MNVHFVAAYTGASSGLHRPNEHVVNPLYHTITDDHCRKSVEKSIDDYEEVNLSSEVKMTPNPAYAVP